MAGVNAGTLSISIVAEIARLQAGLDKAKRAVSAASGDIARNARAANDNLAAIGKGAGAGMREFSGEVARLKAQLDPTWAALQKYKQEVFLLSQAYRQGAVTQQQYTAGIMRSREAWQNASNGVVTATNAQRAGMQQLSMQIGDMATMFSLGAKPMQIFASQSGQVVQAIQLMAGTSKGFIGFLAGPWGMAITAAVTVLASLGAAYLDAGDDAEEAAETLEDALKRFRSGLAEVSDMSAVMTAATRERVGLLVEQARVRREIETLDAMRTIPGAPAQGLEAANRRQAAARDRLAEIESEITAIDNRVRAAASEGRLRDQLDREAQQRADARAEAERNANRSARERRQGLSDEARAAIQQTRETERYIESLQDELAQLTLSEEAYVARQVSMQRAAATTDAQRASIDELARSIIAVQRAQETQQAVAAVSDENMQIRETIAGLEREARAVGVVGYEREQLMLTLEHQAETQALLSRIANAEADGQMQVADALREQLELRQAVFDQRSSIAANDNEIARMQERWGEMDDWLANVNKTAEQMQMAFEQVRMDGLDALTDGLVDAMTGFRSLGDVARSVLSQILADLLRLQIQQSIIGPLASALGMFGSGPSAGLVGSVTGAMNANPGLFARGTLSAPAGMAIVGEEGPELVRLRGGERIYPAGQTQQMLGGGAPVFNINVSGPMSADEARRTGTQIGSAAAKQFAQKRRTGLAG